MNREKHGVSPSRQWPSASKAAKLDVLLQLGLDYKLAEHLVKHNTIDELNELIRLELEAQCRRKGKFCGGIPTNTKR